MAGGTIFRPPYTAVRNLAHWAVDLWPYVNGKAIMSGVRLLELDSADMMDVIHYILEADLAENMNEYSEVKDTYRTRIYEDFYGEEYVYASPSSRKSKSFNPDLPPIDEPFEGDFSEKHRDPVTKETKRYIPPTKFSENLHNPYEGVLDAPLN